MKFSGLELAESKAQLNQKFVADRPMSGWKTALFVSSAADVAPATRRTLYFINFDKSRVSGSLVLDLKYQERLKNGEWGAVKNARFDALAIDEFPHAEDRALLGLLLSPLNTARKTLSSLKALETSLEVDPLLTETTLLTLVRAGRLFVQAEEPLQVVLDDEPWSFQLNVSEGNDESSEVLHVDGLVKRGREKHLVRQSKGLLLLRENFFLRGEKLSRVSWGRFFDLAKRLQSQTLAVPRRDEVEFVCLTAEEAGFPVVQLPPSLQWPVDETPPIARARFVQADPEANGFKFEAFFDYAGFAVDPTSEAKVVFDAAKKTRRKRDLKAERTFLKTLKSESVDLLSAGFVKKAELPQLAQSLLENGWILEVNGRGVRTLSEPQGVLRKVSEDFLLEASFPFVQETISLERFAASCIMGERFLDLPSNAIGFISDEWLKKIELLLRGASLEANGTLRFKKVSIPLFKPLFEEMPGLQIDPEARTVFEGLGRLLQTVSAEKPRELKANLRSYQSEGLGWLETVASSGFGGILADDMGLGKTMQIISYLLRRATIPRTGPRPSLVVLPKSLVFNWLAEIEKFGPRLRVLDFAGATRGMLRANDYDVVVTTYHILKNELDRFEKIEFDTIILDEAQTIKNPGSQIAKAVCQLKGNFRFALSGTPIENSLLDLFSLMKFTNPGLLPQSVIATVGDGRMSGLSRESLNRLSVALSPFILRRTKKQVLKELPEKTEQALVCELEGEQRKLYDRLRKQFKESIRQQIAEKGVGGSKMQVLEALLRLRQAACHPGLVEEAARAGSSAKFEMLLEHLEEIRSAGHKALVFSQFTSFLELLKPHLQKAGFKFEYLDGQTRDRGSVVDRFNSDPSTTVFLISLKAGGTGLNLTTASYVFLLDPWWNPAIEAQAIDRAYRMGQKQKVMAYRLIARGTIEEKIMKLQAQKRSLAEAVINEDSSLLRSLSVDDLAGLFE